MLAVVSLNTGSGYESNFVNELRVRKSTQNLNFGLPPGLRLGTRMTGSTMETALSYNALR